MSVEIGATPNISETENPNGNERIVVYDPNSNSAKYVQVKNLQTPIVYTKTPGEYFGGGEFTTTASIYGVGVQQAWGSEQIFQVIDVPLYGTLTTEAIVRVYKKRGLPLDNSTAVSISSLQLIEEFTFNAGQFNTSSSGFLSLQLADELVLPANTTLIVVANPSASTVSVRIHSDDATHDALIMKLASDDWSGSFNAASSGYNCTGFRLRKLLGATTAYVDAAIVSAVVIKQTIESPIITCSSSVYVADGVEFNLWSDAVALPGKTINITSSKGKQYERGYRYTGETGDVGITSDITIKAKDLNGVLVDEKVITLKPVAKGVGAGTKQILMIGDSLTAPATTQVEIANLISENGGITPYWLGTQGTSPIRHEGRPGWAFGAGVNGFTGTSSPFYIGGRLDFKSYMSNNGNFGGSDVIDYVIIQLGINDIGVSDYVFTNVTTFVNYAKTLVNAILDATYGYPACKIILSLTPISCNTNDGFGSNYNAYSAGRMQYERNMRVFINGLISAFDNFVYAQNVSVCSSHLWVDRYYGYPTAEASISSRVTTTKLIHTNAVHPATSGYMQIADAIYSHLMGLLS